ncbi:hypothetical protein [Nocardiopsis sp. Huas11]|uniref:hypothetical protein n=1 Tax=Nocardiopsis sp. Huas11 TaxID=2183912 RepID=UPI000EAEB0CF|nr:hypothetical protein [Nocardiopsis sp. Huas11]
MTVEMSSISRMRDLARSMRSRWRALVSGAAAMALAGTAAVTVPGAASATPVDRPDTGSLTVVLATVPQGNEGEDVTGASPAGEGRAFDAESTTAEIGGLPGSRTTTGDGTGSVRFGLAYPRGIDTAPITVRGAELSEDGLVTQDGANAVCADPAVGEKRLPVANTDPASDSKAGGAGFTVEVPAGAAVTCTVYQRQEAADVRVDLLWVVDGEELAPESRPEGFDARLTLTGPGGTGAVIQDWGVAREGYGVGDTVTVDVSALVGHDGYDGDDECVLTAARLTGAGGETVAESLPADVTLPEPRSAYTVVNEVVCGDAASEASDVPESGATEELLEAPEPPDDSGSSESPEGYAPDESPESAETSESSEPSETPEPYGPANPSDSPEPYTPDASLPSSSPEPSGAPGTDVTEEPQESPEPPEPSESPESNATDESSESPEVPEPSEPSEPSESPESPGPSESSESNAPNASPDAPEPSDPTSSVESIDELPPSSPEPPSPSGPAPEPLPSSEPSPASGPMPPLGPGDGPDAPDRGQGGLGAPPDLGTGGHPGHSGHTGDSGRGGDRSERPLALTGPSIGFAVSGALFLTGLGLAVLLVARERRQSRARGADS